MIKTKKDKIKIIKLSQIRSIHHQEENKKIKSDGIDMDKWFMNPYSYIKFKYFIETSALIVFFAQFTKISPNNITGIYIILGFLSGLFLASNNDTLIFLSLIFLFTKNSYLCGFGVYLYNKENNFLFIILALLIILMKAVDLKDYSYHLAMYKLFKTNKKSEIINKINMKNNNMFKKNNPHYLTKIKNFIQNFIDERSRTIDIIILLIFIDNYYFNITLLNYIYFYIFFKTLLIFIGGIYITCYKNYLFKK